MVRYKNRYVVVELLPNGKPGDIPLKLKQNSFHEAVTEKVEQMHGIFGSAAIQNGFVAKYCNYMTRIAILRVRHGPHKLVCSVLPFINSVDSKSVTIRTMYVGATLKHCFRFIGEFQKEYLNKKLAGMSSVVKRRVFEAAVLDLTRCDYGVQKLT